MEPGEKENSRGEKGTLFFKALASLTEGTILRRGFAVFIPGAGVAKCQCP